MEYTKTDLKPKFSHAKMDDYNTIECAYTKQITDTDMQCRHKCSCRMWQYIVVATVLVTLFQQQKISFNNYSQTNSHINDGQKNQCFRRLLCPNHQG